ncbi:MAG: VPDSG-CTERM sorting domain-containing protein [Verrucomicrobiales bacterium]|nr:VPDSG-CTERM sorting domain-containing protein [Verrucomicrobiales bacterium]
MRCRFLLTTVAVGVFGFARIATANFADTLDGLLADPNNTVSIGAMVWSNFTADPTNLDGYDPDLITVTASIERGVHYLTYSGVVASVIKGAGGAPEIGDLLLSYTVRTTGGNVITMIDQSYAGSAQPFGGGFLSIDENVYDGTAIVGNSHLEETDLSDPFAEVGPDLFTNNKSTYRVIKHIGLGVEADAGGFVTVSQIRQSYHQHGPCVCPDSGMTAGLLGLALGALGFIRRKIMT